MAKAPVKTPKKKSSHLHKVVRELIGALHKSGHLEHKVADKLSDLLATSGEVGCCTFVLAGQTHHSNMTEPNCEGLNGSWTPFPC